MKLLCIVVFACALPTSAFSSADDDRAAVQQKLDAECEAARELQLEPERAAFVRECVRTKMKSSLQECQRFYRDYGAQTGDRPALYYDLPECVAAFDYRRSYRQ